VEIYGRMDVGLSAVIDNYDSKLLTNCDTQLKPAWHLLLVEVN